MQRGLTTHGGSVRVGVVLDQVDDDVHVPHERSHVQGSQSRLETENQSLKLKCVHKTVMHAVMN